MSHNMDIKTQIRDKNALVLALERMGFKGKIEVQNKPMVMYNYNGYEVPEKAEIVIRRQHIHRLSNDFGFTKQTDGTFKAIVDDGYMVQHTDWMDKLSTYYGVEVAKQEATAKGYKVLEDLDERNRPRLRIKMGGGSNYSI